MAKWTVSDGTTVESGGDVAGHSRLAIALRAEVSDLAIGAPVTVCVAAQPGGDIPLDLKDDWVVDAWVRFKAALAGLDVTTDYEPTDDDMPDAARELRARANDAGEDAVY